MLDFTEELLTRHGIQHWLDYGTLVGAVRDEQFISWDDDVDFGVLAEDGNRILALEPQITGAGHHLDLRRKGVARIVYSSMNSNGADVHMWSRQGDRLVPGCTNELDWPGAARAFPASYLDAFTEVRLYDRSFPAPAPLDGFLRHRYGPGYMTPFRGVRAGSPWCPRLTPEEMTPAATRLFARISEREVVLRQLLYSSSRLHRIPHWQRYWIDAALPHQPASWARAHAERGVGPDERTAAVQALIDSLARLEQAIAELQHPSRSMRFKRAGRRVACASAPARRRLRKTLRGRREVSARAGH